MIKKQAPGETILKVGGMLLLFLGVMLAFGSGSSLSMVTRGSTDNAVVEYLQKNGMTYAQLVARTVMQVLFIWQQVLWESNRLEILKKQGFVWEWELCSLQR